MEGCGCDKGLRVERGVQSLCEGGRECALTVAVESTVRGAGHGSREVFHELIEGRRRVYTCVWVWLSGKQGEVLKNCVVNGKPVGGRVRESM